jgi:hypothetical protein
MYSNLIGKARNVVVEIHLRSCNMQLAGKIIEVDEVFVEVLVWIDVKTGNFAKDRATFEQAESGKPGWRSDRVLVNIEDISIIA